MEHAKFMLRLLQSPLPIVVCLRAKFKTRQGKNEQGKTCIIKDDHTSPIQAEDFIFEMTAHAEIFPDHSINLTKCSHPTLRDCFPTKGPISTQTGELLAKWCNAPGKSATKTDPDRDAAVKELWSLTKPIHHGNKQALQQHCWDEAFIEDTKTLEDFDAAGIRKITDKIRAKAAA
jgi:hypothetical protein